MLWKKNHFFAKECIHPAAYRSHCQLGPSLLVVNTGGFRHVWSLLTELGCSVQQLTRREKSWPLLPAVRDKKKGCGDTCLFTVRLLLKKLRKAYATKARKQWFRTYLAGLLIHYIVI